MTSIEDFKRGFFTSGKYIHLNNAGHTPTSKPARDAIVHWIQRFHEEGDRCAPDAMRAVEQTRNDLGRLLGAKAAEIAFFSTTAAALSQVAFGFPLAKGDEILVWDQEYPSNFYPWMIAAERAGARLVVVPSGPQLETPAEAMLARVTARTKVMAFSWVQYRTGAITNYLAITAEARRRGIFTCADLIQGAGVLPFDFEKSGLDAACGGSHKWMTALSCSAYLMLRPEHVLKLKPSAVGAMSFGGWDDLSRQGAELKPDMTRFEPGAKGFLEVIAFGASLQLLLETGITAISSEAERLSSRLVLGLSELGYLVHSPHGDKHRGAIMNFSASPKAPLKSLEAIESRLLEKHVAFGKRPPGIRLSPHAFNRQEEIDRVIEFLDEESF